MITDPRRLLPPADPELIQLLGQAKYELEIREFKKSPWYAIEQGWVITQDEHADPAKGVEPVRPFPSREYLKYITKIVMSSQAGMLMKSRQLRMTWLFCWLLLWEAITKPGRLCVAQGKREEDVLAKGDKGLMGRIRFMRRHLPAHVRPRLIEATKSVEVYDNGSTVLAIPQGPDIIRSLTASFVFMDELAFHPEGEEAWTAALPTVKGGGRIWGVTTPNGIEFCYEQADERMKWDDCLNKWPEAIPGLHGYQNGKGVQLLALHYTADPDKCTPDYQKEIMAGYTDMNLYRRENELDFSLQPGEGVYIDEFKEATHVLPSPYVVNRKMPIYRGWDFGYNGQAVSFFQHNARGQLVWFDQVFFKRVPLQDVIREAQKRTLQHVGQYNPTTLGKSSVVTPLYDLEGNRIEGAYLARDERTVAGLVQDFGDPSSEAHNTQGESDRNVLAQFGIILYSKPTTSRKLDLVEQIRALLLPRSDGTPALLISPGPATEMKLVVKGFKGGYHYPESKIGRADKLRPHKDGIFDHIFDSAQYAIDWIKPIRGAMVDEDSLEGGSPWWRDSAWNDNPWNDQDQGDRFAVH